MPFQPINFAAVDPVGYPGLRNLTSDLQSGMQTAFMPAREQRSAQAAELANALQRLKMQYLPQEFQSRQALRAAQTAKAQQEAEQQEVLRNILKQRVSGSQAGGSGGNGAADELAEQVFRHAYKLPTEFPSEKIKNALIAAKQKKEMESQYLTGPAKAEHEEVLARAPQFIRGLEQLIDAPSPANLRVPFTDIRWRPAPYKQHETLVADLGETFARLRGYPVGKGGQEKAISQLERAPYETDFAYRQRLKKLFPEIAQTVAESSQALNKPLPDWAKKILFPKQNKSAQSLSSLSDEELRKIALGESYGR